MNPELRLHHIQCKAIKWVGCIGLDAMSQTTQTDGGRNVDDRIAAIETIQIDWETFKKTLKRNYLDKPTKWTDRSFVLRLYPPFEAEMDADYYESEKGRHYDNNWDQKPLHIKPELLITEGTDRGFRSIFEWPTETTTRNALQEDDIEDAGGIEAAVEEGREIFWDELKHSLPETIDLGRLFGGHPQTHEVEIEWKFEQ